MKKNIEKIAEKDSSGIATIKIMIPIYGEIYNWQAMKKEGVEIEYRVGITFGLIGLKYCAMGAGFYDLFKGCHII